MLQMILLLLPGVLSNEWKVNYSPPICDARGSSVTVACTFTYPPAEVKRVLWCSMISNNDKCVDEPYVYDSNSNKQRNFQYIGDKTSNCSLLISNIRQTYSGEYKFRFITNLTDGRYTGHPGVKISVQDLKVSMSRFRENGSTIVGDSLNLTCKLDCPGNLAEVQWFKNGELMQHSAPVLIFSSVTTKDSGNYSCSLRNFKSTVSEEFRIYIEDIPLPSIDVTGSPSVLIIVVSLVSLGLIIAAVMLLRRRKARTHGKPQEEGEETQVSPYSTHQTTAKTQTPTVSTNLEEAEVVLQEDEVQYASVNIQPKILLQKSANTEEQIESSIYSTVMNG